MNIQVAGSPNEENELEEYIFRVSFSESGFLLHLSRFNSYRRESEFEEWVLHGAFMFPDLLNRSTLPEPELPTWAMNDARTNLLQHISFQ